MIKKRIWEGIAILLLILILCIFGIWYYVSFINKPVPLKGVYVNNNQGNNGGSCYASLYKGL